MNLFAETITKELSIWEPVKLRDSKARQSFRASIDSADLVTQSYFLDTALISDDYDVLEAKMDVAYGRVVDKKTVYSFLGK